MENSGGQSRQVRREKTVRRIYGALPAAQEMEKGDEEKSGSPPSPTRGENTIKKEQSPVYLKGRLERITYRALNGDWMERDDLRVRIRMYGMPTIGRVQLHYALERLENKGLIERKAKKSKWRRNEWLWKRTSAYQGNQNRLYLRRVKEGS